MDRGTPATHKLGNTKQAGRNYSTNKHLKNKKQKKGVTLLTLTINNELLDQIKKELQCESDSELAARIKVAPGTLTKMRQGKTVSMATVSQVLTAAALAKIPVVNMKDLFT